MYISLPFFVLIGVEKVIWSARIIMDSHEKSAIRRFRLDLFNPVNAVLMKSKSSMIISIYDLKSGNDFLNYFILLFTF